MSTFTIDANNNITAYTTAEEASQSDATEGLVHFDSPGLVSPGVRREARLNGFHTLRREQWLPRPLDEVFAFFSDARNLEELTPPWLGFRILTSGPIMIAAGTRIRYRLAWRGLPVTWTTQIRRWDPPFRFIDVQLSGSYRLWHHTHRFETRDGGTRMTDVVRYRLPFGMIGRAVHALKVRRDVE